MSTIDELRTKISGEVLVSGDADFEMARTIMISKGAPAVAVRPKTAQDVARAITYAKENGLVISIKSGGHSNAGFSTNDGGMVIDMLHFKTVELIDEAKHIVRIGSGALWGEVAQQLSVHGLALSSGDTKTVGVGGLTTGGGIGWMVRKYGLAIDSLNAAEIVTASGEVLRVSEQEHADLFWAIRGGGGNFGVVTYFEFAAHPTREVYAGTIMYDFASFNALLKGWRDYMRTAPEELTTMIMAMPANPAFGSGTPMVMLMFVYAGEDETAAMQTINPLLEIGTVTTKDIQKKPYADVLEDAHMPPGVKVITNSSFITDLTDEAIDTITAQSGMILQLRSLGGAMNRVEADATAFAHRNSEVLIVSPTFVAPQASPQEIENALKPWRAIEAFGNGGYSNFFSERTEHEVKASYPEQTYRRLCEVKAIYDPENVFNQTYNVAPKSA